MITTNHKNWYTTKQRVSQDHQIIAKTNMGSFWPLISLQNFCLIHWVGSTGNRTLETPKNFKRNFMLTKRKPEAHLEKSAIPLLYTASPCTCNTNPLTGPIPKMETTLGVLSSTQQGQQTRKCKTANSNKKHLNTSFTPWWKLTTI